jgi:hypothetical protein
LEIFRGINLCGDGKIIEIYVRKIVSGNMN